MEPYREIPRDLQCTIDRLVYGTVRSEYTIWPRHCVNTYKSMLVDQYLENHVAVDPGKVCTRVGTLCASEI